MFDDLIIIGAFGSIFILAWIASFLADKQYWLAFEGFNIIIFILSCYCLAASIDMISDWVDPLQELNSTTSSEANHTRKGGLILLVISFWPYVLLASSAWFAWYSKNRLQCSLLIFFERKRETVDVRQIEGCKEGARSCARKGI